MFDREVGLKTDLRFESRNFTEKPLSHLRNISDRFPQLFNRSVNGFFDRTGGSEGFMSFP